MAEGGVGKSSEAGAEPPGSFAPV
ncbi:MAG: hypothetical protein QOD95_2805, partial [Gammaproteobacteria bacterium]|nr:hypothetical protein [Gammaproteobacteria bacterium]